MIPHDAGIPCHGLDDAFRAEDTRKSNLLLEGQLLEAQGQPDAAIEKYAAAAAIEERLGPRARELGLTQLAWIHELSAVGCWARAGNLYTAERLGRVLLADPNLTERLQRHIQTLLDSIRSRR
jgi:hypothetical protein